MVVFDLCSSCGGSGSVWGSAFEGAGISYYPFSGVQLDTKEKREALDAKMERRGREELTLVLFSSHGMEKDLEEYFKSLGGALLVLPIGSDAVLLNRGTCDPLHVGEVNRYLAYGGDENLRGAAAYIHKYIFADPRAGEPPAPLEKPFSGIYLAENDQTVFADLCEFLQTRELKYPIYVGILSHRHAYLNNGLQAEKEIVRALHQQGIGAVPVFSSNERSGELLNARSYEFEEIVERYFSIDGRLFISGLINFQMHLIKAWEGLSVAENSARLFSQLDIPVFHPIASYTLTPKSYEELTNPLAGEQQSAYLNPEMAGMVEPVLVALRDEKTREVVPLVDNIRFFAERVKKWMDMRTKANADKKLVLMLHNSVCAGVEATIGKAFGLDAFESIVRVLKRLQKEGYAVDYIPDNGKELLALILERKAFSDFRWTSPEDNAASNGCLYRMPCGEYRKYLEELPEPMQQQMLDSWGAPPGEGMVLGNDILVTGVSFGNVAVMVQPKRGCYGSKCTGEVCRILHDPSCPPAHPYLAAYRTIQRVMKADAVVHFGTDGSLEYLPGKGSGLTAASWSYAVLGSLPNLYPYHLGVMSEGTTAKRRANAVLLGYLPPSCSGFDQKGLHLIDRINAYTEACDLENGQEEELQTEIEALLKESKNLQAMLESAGSFLEGAILVRSSLLKCGEGRKLETLHVFGRNPDRDECARYIAEVLCADGVFEKKEEESEPDFQNRVYACIVMEMENPSPQGPIAAEIAALYQLLQKTKGEEENLIHGLNGGFIMPSPSGMPDENGRKILPSGRNFYMMNMEKIPTKTAYRRGALLAAQLLNEYLRDEGGYPHKIAMNMISIDIARTHGEQLSQFLNLLGVTPCWDSRGRVTGLEAIEATALGRPRIDVTLRISGVMRDTWPDAVNLMDEAVLLVSSLPEKEEENYVLGNIREMERECGDIGERAKTIRIFGDPPGAFGAGIDLALKASAWNDDKDLARYFIQSSAFAYGKGLNGRKSVREFVENAKRVELTCDTSSSRRMDTLACGFGLQIHGGFKLVAETIGKRKIRQYQSSNEIRSEITTATLAECVERDIAETLLSAAWLDCMMIDGYSGASELMHRVQNVFDAKCTSGCVSDKTLDKIAEELINNERMREWLMEQNPYAAEEIGRRLLELQSRGKWAPDEEVFQKLQNNYLSLEGLMESELTGKGEVQGGSVEIVGDSQVENWKKNLAEIDAYLDRA